MAWRGLLRPALAKLLVQVHMDPDYGTGPTKRAGIWQPPSDPICPSPILTLFCPPPTQSHLLH